MGKIILRNQLENIRNTHPRACIVAACGCFDIFHIGHLDYLKGAKHLGDLLIVGVNSDKSIFRLKGTKTIFCIEQRMSVISALTCVDYVFCFEEIDFGQSLRLISPHVFARGVDADIKGCPEQKIIEKYHITVIKVGDYKKSSSKELRPFLQGGIYNI